jgi:hypothetical protein
MLQGNTPGQISNAVLGVFVAHGYAAGPATYTSLMFEKQASKMDNIAYGDWISDVPVWLRVKVRIVPISEACFRLQCHAFLVTDRNEVLEHEREIKHHNKPYQELLNEVAERLGNKVTGKGNG